MCLFTWNGYKVHTCPYRGWKIILKIPRGLWTAPLRMTFVRHANRSKHTLLSHSYPPSPRAHVQHTFTSHPCYPVTRTYLSIILMKLTICSFHLFHPLDNPHSNWINVSAPRTGKMKTAILCTAPDIFTTFTTFRFAHARRKWHKCK